MNLNKKVTGIVIFGVLLSFVLPHLITMSLSKELKEPKVSSTVQKTQTKNSDVTVKNKKETEKPTEIAAAPAEEQPQPQAEPEPTVEVEQPQEETVINQPEPVNYEDMTSEDLINAINAGTYKMEYSALYNAGSNRLEKAKGAIYYGGHKETYYSERVLPGTSLNIPGRHVADDGTVRDGDGYICVATNSSYMSKGTIVKTSLGPAKVYDSGCAYGIVDIYTNW